MDISTDLIKEIRATYEQNGKVILEKETEDFTMSGFSAKVKLTQEETMLFNAPSSARIQLHVRTNGGNAFVARPITIPVYILLNKKEV
jgi:hypothetical protein